MFPRNHRLTSGIKHSTTILSSFSLALSRVPTPGAIVAVYGCRSGRCLDHECTQLGSTDPARSGGLSAFLAFHNHYTSSPSSTLHMQGLSLSPSLSVAPRTFWFNRIPSGRLNIFPSRLQNK